MTLDEEGASSGPQMFPPCCILFFYVFRGSYVFPFYSVDAGYLFYVSSIYESVILSILSLVSRWVYNIVTVEHGVLYRFANA